MDDSKAFLEVTWATACASERVAVLPVLLTGLF
jgi:hypothetical protein